MVIGLIFLALAIVVGISIPFINKMVESKMSGSKSNNNQNKDKEDKKSSKDKNTAKPKDLKSLWEIKDIRNGVIILTENRYRAVIKMGTVDFDLMSKNEQDSIETALMTLAHSLDSNVQLYTTTEMVDTRAVSAEIREQLKNIPENLKWYGQYLLDYVEGISVDRSTCVRQSYMIIEYTTNKGFPYARKELTSKATRVTYNLSKAKIYGEMLSTEGVVDLLHHMFNRNRIARPAELVEAGGLNLYKSNSRGVIVDEDTLYEQEEAG